VAATDRDFCLTRLDAASESVDSDQPVNWTHKSNFRAVCEGWRA